MLFTTLRSLRLTSLAIRSMHGVAGQQQSQIDLLLESLVGQRRIARAENNVAREFDPELFLQLRLYVDLRENAEAFVLEAGFHSGHRVLEREVHPRNITVFLAFGSLHRIQFTTILRIAPESWTIL